MKKFFIIMIILIALALVAGSLAGLFWGLFRSDGVSLDHPDHIVLQMDMSQPMIEEHSSDPFQRFTTRGNLRLLDTVRTIDKAAEDPKVEGLVADLSELSMGMAQLQEIREAVRRFHDTGKWTIAYADTFFSSQTGTGVYYLASAFDEIYMHPTGDVGFLGLAIEPFFVRNTLDRLGIVPYMNQRYEYKTVANMWNETAYTDAHRETDNQLLQSIFGEIVRGVAASRNMSEDEVRNLVNRAPFIGQEAIDARLVDGFRFWDEVEKRIEEKTGAEVSYLKTGEYYHKHVGEMKSKGDEVIALVYGLGEVIRGDSTSSMTGDPVMASKALAEAFRQIREDEDVRVVVFRVNSPGGSPDASATIAHEVKLTREAGIPVIVSMGDVAASGGYYVAMYADQIVAEPMTLTGSIGVAGGKFVITGLLNKVGITTDEIHAGDNSRLLSMFAQPDEKQMERFHAMMDRIYEDFTKGVMEGRGMDAGQIDKVARGRVWTGAEAVGVNLVDKLGGLNDALRIAAELAELPDGEEPAVRIFPRKKTWLESIRESGGFLAHIREATRTFIRLMHIVDRLGGTELRDLDRSVSADWLTAPVDSRSLEPAGR